MQEFIKIFPFAINENVKLIIEDASFDDYKKAVPVLQKPELILQKEKNERCYLCYYFRMQKTFLFASNNNFDWWTTTLSISPFKDSYMINYIGTLLQRQNPNTSTKFLESDFKKKNGFLRSLQLSHEYHLYRQHYCGCPYSIQNK